MRQRLERTGVIDYQVERHNSDWADHIVRTDVTAAVLAGLEPEHVLDPACGDGSIILAAIEKRPIPGLIAVNDISVPNHAFLKAEIARRMDGGTPENWVLSNVDVDTCLAADFSIFGEFSGIFDVVVLTEILEHLEDPDLTLSLAHDVGRALLVSSPLMRHGQIDGNPEHLWMFDSWGYREMLEAAGWKVETLQMLQFPTSMYDFGIWVARA